MTVTVLGATGKTGGATAAALLEKGVAVRAVARTPKKLAELAGKGAQTVTADTADAKALATAIGDSDALYAMIPGDYTRPDLLGQYGRAGEAIAQAIKLSGVKRIVFLSSLGAERPAGTGPIAGLHRAEELLKSIPGVDLLLLRPGYFYENHYGTLGLIKQQGINGGAMVGDVPVPMIASHDIGIAAAQALATGDFSGVSVRELTGPRPLTMAETTTILGRAIGKPDLRYVQFPEAGFIEGLKGNGFSDDAARLFAEMSQAFNAGTIRPQPGSQRVTTTTSFEAFADQFARAYSAA